MRFVQKYQPRKYGDYVGQECVSLVRDLAKGHKMGENPLLVGPYGSGKSSLARTYAISRKCDNFRIVEDLCGECDSCREYLDGPSSAEYGLWIKVKASALIKVDDVFAVFESRSYDQTFFFDEIQVLSREIQTAIIEQMDAMVGLPYGACIFATTELNMVIGGLRSRCTPVRFNLVSDDVLFGHLKAIAASEGINIDDAALMRVAEYGQGHVRDAVMALDMIRNAAHNARQHRIDEDYALARLGYADDKLMLELLTDILEKRDFFRIFKKLASHRAMDFPVIAWRVLERILRSQYDPSVQASYKDMWRYGRKILALADHLSSQDFRSFDEIQQLYVRLDVIRYAVADIPSGPWGDAA